MNNNTVEILAAEPRSVKYGNQVILVREIAWLDLLRFVELVSAKASDLLRVTPEGKAELDLAKLPDLIKSSDELVRFLVKISTDLPESAPLPARAMLKLIDVALEVNLNEEFISAGKSVASRLAAALPSQAKAQSAASSKP